VVQDDGSFSGWAFNSGNNQYTSLRGEISQNSIEADTGNSYCKNHLSLKKITAPGD
jgi:hypothetical protein